MTDYSFEDSTILDVVPPAIDVEYPCRVCGREAGPYGGRGRKPVLCEEHKANKSTSKPKVKGANANLAAQATEILVQLNNVLTMPLMLTGYTQTASAISATEDGFRDAVYNALLTDPGLCSSICRGGSSSGKLALCIAYGMFGSAIAPVAIMEYKSKQPLEETE